MNTLKVWLFKENGTFYSQEIVDVPKDKIFPEDIINYMEDKHPRFKSMTVVVPMEEYWIRNGYPHMLMAGRE